MTDFIEATSLPVNVPIHRSKEASRPSTPMREEFDRCNKQLPYSLASKLISTPSYKFSEFLGEEWEKKGRKIESRKEEGWRRREESEGEQWWKCDFMFKIEL